MTSIHETGRRLRVLLAHLAKHPDLPNVAEARTHFDGGIDISVDGDTTRDFLAWCASLDHPKVRVPGPSSRGRTMLWGRGFIGADLVRVSSHVSDAPDLGEWSEGMPLIGFRHVLKRAGWDA